jgi:hypothetical protein
VSATDEALGALAEQLNSIAEQLADLAIDCLHQALGGRSADGPDAGEAERAQMLERRLTRARRAVEKAAHLLGATVADPDGEPA